MAICPTGILTLGTPCSRLFWAALLPSAFLTVWILFAILLPPLLPEFVYRALRPIRNAWTNFLPLREAEALAYSPSETLDTTEQSDDAQLKPAPVRPRAETLLIPVLSLALALTWLALASYTLLLTPTPVPAIPALLIALTHLWTALHTLLRPSPTPRPALVILLTLNLIGAFVLLGGALFDRAVGEWKWRGWGEARVWALVLNATAIAVEMSVVLGMPVAIRSARVKEEDVGLTVSPEDYTTLWGWMSFTWILPLIRRGTNTTLNEADVWALSPTMQSRPLYIKFSSLYLNPSPSPSPSSGTPPKKPYLAIRLFKANSLDLLLDFTLTYVSVIFNYAGPFFLKRILDSLDRQEGEAADRRRALAYVWAVLAFLSTLCKAESDVQHLWFGRRAATRVRTELMVAIYDKALKRKDFSGIVDKDARKGPAGAGKGKKDDSTADDPKAGADIGKIVNLMAGDAGRVANLISGAYFLYGAPFEILVASIFLYQLLGLSAFAGFAILIASWPLNNYVARRSVRIQKGVSTARDKRMGVLNELIGAVKFIKFFAWEDQWIKRAMGAREVEMQWMLKARINNVLFSLIWTTAPILVSVTSFLVYILQGNELTIGTAFTAIALFQMIRAPLNVIPAWIVNVLQTKVGLDRIATFLDEEEVDEQVSSLKRSRVPRAQSDEDGLGIENGTFKWNEVEEQKDKDVNKAKQKTAAVPSTGSDDSETAVDIQSTTGDAEVADTDHRFELRDISVLFPEGELTVITGPTASGKTALLMALLGELTLLEGRIIMSKNPSKVDEHGLTHTISYAAQSPWLRHQSIKENILFGYPLDEARYQAVVECCALKPDLAILEDGDATEIGARGVSLSGGQKARVALARAVYAPSKYVLLDDPLSAVDSHTARFLFEKLLRGPLLQHRTVVLVTHHVELVLPGTYYLVRMLDGRIDTQGTVKELRAKGVIDDITHSEAAEAHKEEEIAEAEEAAASATVENEADVVAPAEEVAKPVEAAKKPRKLIEEEKRETGSVKWRIYNTYLKASSYWTWGILIILIILTQALGVAEKVWIKIWGEAYGNTENALSHLYALGSFSTPAHEVVMDDMFSSHHITHRVHSISAPLNILKINWPSAQERPFFYIGIYAAISLSTGIVSITGIMTQYTGALRASRVLFARLLETVVRATMRWHDVTPAGRMLNRFSKDVETVDSSLASSLQAVNSSLANFAASIITVIVVFPLFIFPATIIGFFYQRAAVGYLNTGRDIRRMESNSRSPIFANFNELLEGIVTVRAFSAEQRFLDNLYIKIDLTTKMWYTFWMTNRWLLLYFDALGATAVLATTLFALTGYVDAGLAGVCITSAMAFTSSVYWTCRFWTALELDLNSVERVVEYLDLPQEAPAIIENNRPPAYWPSSSSPNRDALIRVEDLEVKYAPELPAVLRNLSFSLKAKERVGLLGRTGSGKSTLAMSILRFADPSKGRIIIDGIDISTIGLYDLRSRITFIPQDATLFSGTLRDNLDPFNEHDDSECLDVLYRVQMITDSQLASQRTSREASRQASRQGSIHEGREGTIASISTVATETEGKTTVTLDTQVSPGGTNFSQGQRQLIAMARALLRRSAIIVLDEATSSIDFATDAKIQATIREEFNDSLLLTVAHRLRTVIDYDRLIVLDKGELAEFDTPLKLIQKEDGIFRSMCLKSGTFAELEAAAQAKAERDGHN